MSKYEFRKLFLKKSKKLLMTSFFWSQSRSWSRTLPVLVSKPKLRSRPVLVSVLVSEKFRGLGLGLGRVGLHYSPVNNNINIDVEATTCIKNNINIDAEDPQFKFLQTNLNI